MMRDDQGGGKGVDPVFARGRKAFEGVQSYDRGNVFQRGILAGKFLFSLPITQDPLPSDITPLQPLNPLGHHSSENTSTINGPKLDGVWAGSRGGTPPYIPSSDVSSPSEDRPEASDQADLDNDNGGEEDALDCRVDCVRAQHQHRHTHKHTRTQSHSPSTSSNHTYSTRQDGAQEAWSSPSDWPTLFDAYTLLVATRKNRHHTEALEYADIP